MLQFIKKSINKLLGDKSSKDLKILYPYVQNINVFFEQYKILDNNALRKKKQELQTRIQKKLLPGKTHILALKKQAADTKDLRKKEQIFHDIDTYKQKENNILENILTQTLPEAYALVKETARRFKENKQLIVTATEQDHILSTNKAYISIEEDKAIWDNQWLVNDHMTTWDMLHYDVQLIGGIILHQGKIAEMTTGEGKTLVATLPIFLNALAGKSVHVITVNDYLAQRDAAWLAPIFEFHGLTVDCIDKHAPHSSERKKAYAADIVYGTNNEFGFDYLRDNMTDTVEDRVQKAHHFAIIDEVDSVLIDDARTPLIISGPVPHKGDEKMYYVLQPRIHKLFEAQKQIIIQFFQEAKNKIAKNKKKEGGLALLRAHRGLPKHKPLIKYLSQTGIRQILQKTENYYLQDNAKMMPEADIPLLFTIDEKNNNIELTEKGIEYITNEEEGSDFFILPDISITLVQIEKDNQLTDQEKIDKKNLLIKEYTIKSQRIHTLTQLLKAYTLFEKDIDYIVINDKVKIVDEQTGRVLEGRRYSEGLHQAIEAKEHVHIEQATQTYATITLQNYFRMYHKIAGMTGTAETEASEFWEIYKLDVVVTPTHRPIIRSDKQDKVYRTIREKFNAIITEIEILSQQKRPVLVGTTSVEISELVSKMLRLRKIKHQVLNAKQHEKEAQIIATAGNPGTVTIATNMAGRGTDIKLTEVSKNAGGLAIIGTERHESRRIDRQLRGRSGRQGDVGSSQFFVSLEDNLMRLFGSDRIARIMDKVGLKEGEVIQHTMITRSIERAQKKVEEDNFGTRKRLLEYDDVMNAQRSIIYKKRKNAVFGERIQMDIMHMFYETVSSAVLPAKEIGNIQQMKLALLNTLGITTKVTKEIFNQTTAANLVPIIYKEAYQFYQERNSLLSKQIRAVIEQLIQHNSLEKNILIPTTDGSKHVEIAINPQHFIDTNGEALIKAIEKKVTLFFIDQYWKEHLRELDDLRQSVQNAVYEQKDPLMVYKFEAFTLFKQLVHNLTESTASYLMKLYIPLEITEAIQEVTPINKPILHESKSNTTPSLMDNNDETPTETLERIPNKSQKIAKRNQRVTVQYHNGEIKKNVKYKTIEEDLQQNQCILIE